MQKMNALAAALLISAGAAMHASAQPYTAAPGCQSRKPATNMAKAKAKKKMAQTSRRKNRK